jgi:hypothetical protein
VEDKTETFTDIVETSISIMMKDYICACVISNFIIWNLSWQVDTFSAEEEIPPRFITIYKIPAMNPCLESFKSKLHTDMQIFCSALCSQTPSVYV